MPRSLQVRQECIGIVKLAVRRKGFPSQRALAEELGFALSTVSNFLTGKPVDFALFKDICEKGLSLEWKEIAATFDTTLPSAEAKAMVEIAINHQDLGETPAGGSASNDRKQELTILEPPAVEDKVIDFVFYIERPPIEERCYSEILKPGCLLRIKAPWQTGKTELMSRLINYVEQKGYRTVVLNLRDATQEDFTNLDKFLQWFCTIFADRLDLTISVEEHWRKSVGNSKIKCRSYFEKYLLPGDNPLALALDEVDRIFPIREIASEFLGMLRTWHEDAKTRQLWRQLRLVVLHSEIYTEVDINQSPFNAGYEVTLTDFNQEQVLDLAQRYGLEWDTGSVTQLMNMVGGHPYLVGKAIEHIAQQDTTLGGLLQTSPTAQGVYSRHLERHWRNLQSNPELACAFQKIVLANSPVEFNSELNQSMAVKLNDLGLVKLSSNSAIPRYELYRQYFRDRFQDNL
ncbi:AAA-like domain-containing protein [Coleofasciculus sp. FACHB-SPT9]|uniref:AAA-like domain-containing protein n=2 Tax=Cyanophyceae TaxID=3028117 RepID=UPI001683DD85|nr:AAA-like domain-containing protein [Coleofasciculus sp. FACHB-SPT9]MBD1889478.1 AAA-like domain-containing protein [Coleofasciculus sp. FACHB-SPT9]